MTRGRTARRTSGVVGALLLMLMLWLPGAVQADSVTTTLMPMGGGYGDAAVGAFSLRAAQLAKTRLVRVLFLPIAYATDGISITKKERSQNLKDARSRSSKMQAQCKAAVKSLGKSCLWRVVPVFTRSDALKKDNVSPFKAKYHGIFMPGGDQTVAMKAVAGTPLEAAMQQAYSRGIVVGGTSAGAAVQGLDMIGGYTGDNGAAQGLEKGAVDIWNQPDSDPFHRGLVFGTNKAMVDQHFFQRGRFGRLINAAFVENKIGMGVEYKTVAQINNNSSVSNIAGAGAVAIIDTTQYGAQTGGAYKGARNVLSIHSVATHIPPPGSNGYDLTTRALTFNGSVLPAPNAIGRDWSSLFALPNGAGTLMLSGDISGDKEGAISQRFVTLAAAKAAPGAPKIAVIGVGYTQDTELNQYAGAFLTKGASQVGVYRIDATTDYTNLALSLSNTTDGIFFTAKDPSLIGPTLQNVNFGSALRNAWLSGKPLLADNAAATALGSFYAPLANPTDTNYEDEASAAFLIATVTPTAGLGWLPFNIEPRLLEDYRWGRLFNQVYHAKSIINVGLAVDTAIEFSPSNTAPKVLGASAVVAVDGTSATTQAGSNGSIGLAWTLVDTFAPGDDLKPGN